MPEDTTTTTEKPAEKAPAWKPREFPVTDANWRGAALKVQAKERQVKASKAAKEKAKKENKPEPVDKAIVEVFPIFTPDGFIDACKVGFKYLEEKRPGMAAEFVNGLVKDLAKNASEEGLDENGKFLPTKYWENFWTVVEPGMNSEAGLKSHIAELAGPLTEHYLASQAPDGWKTMGYATQAAFNAKMNTIVTQLQQLEARLADVVAKKADKAAKAEAAEKK